MLDQEKEGVDSGPKLSRVWSEGDSSQTVGSGKRGSRIGSEAESS